MSSIRKKWISAEVDGRLVAQLEREAEARGISRSEALRRALQEWTREAMEEDEERVTRTQENHRRVMNRLDFIVGMIREQERAGKKPTAGRNGEHPAGGPPEGSVDGYTPRAGGGVRRTDAEDEEPRRSALAEARKRARRRLE